MSRGPSATQRLALLLVAAAVPVTLVTVNVRLLASAAYLRWEYGRAHFPAAPGFTADERLAVAVPSTVFILGDTPPAALAALRRGDAPLYTESEIAHLVDVQRRVRILLAAGAFGAVAVGIALAAAAWGRARRAAAAVARGARATVGLVVVVGLGIAAVWPWLFTTFHEVLFPPGTWQFAADSGLITLFPGVFWYDSAIVLAALTAVEALGLAAVAGWLRRRAAPRA